MYCGVRTSFRTNAQKPKNPSFKTFAQRSYRSLGTSVENLYSTTIAECAPSTRTVIDAMIIRIEWEGFLLRFFNADHVLSANRCAPSVRFQRDFCDIQKLGVYHYLPVNHVTKIRLSVSSIPRYPKRSSQSVLHREQ